MCGLIWLKAKYVWSSKKKPPPPWCIAPVQAFNVQLHHFLLMSSSVFDPLVFLKPTDPLFRCHAHPLTLCNISMQWAAHAWWRSGPTHRLGYPEAFCQYYWCDWGSLRYDTQSIPEDVCTPLHVTEVKLRHVNDPHCFLPDGFTSDTVQSAPPCDVPTGVGDHGSPHCGCLSVCRSVSLSVHWSVCLVVYMQNVSISLNYIMLSRLLRMSKENSTFYLLVM